MQKPRCLKHKSIAFDAVASFECETSTIIPSSQQRIIVFSPNAVRGEAVFQPPPKMLSSFQFNPKTLTPSLYSSSSLSSLLARSLPSSIAKIKLLSLNFEMDFEKGILIPFK